ncbi:unnamed protein product [Auanema sp. JU1783]|nr:unnamed protein product [Auanema sp. JU1783]
MACPEFVTLRDGERFNPATFTNIIFVDDARIPLERKSANSLAEYRKHFKSDSVKLATAQFTPFKTENLPVPYKYTDEYNNYTEPSAADYDAMIEYVCDEEDGFWLELINEKRKRKRLKPYTTDVVEQVIDRLEKESVFEVRGPNSMMPGSSMDTDDACCICGDGDVNNANQIIYCDMCNIAVHQECYGVPYIPEGQWLCRRCKLSPSTSVNCCLCPNSGGAYKQTSDGRWAHVICAIWLNEVHFGNAVFLEPIEGAENSLKRRAKLKCLVCRNKMGACLQCSTRSCLKAFHVTCAQQSGMSMRVTAKPDANDPDGLDVQRFVYCHLHTENDRECGGNPHSRKKRMDDAIRNARRHMAVKTHNGPTVNMPKITFEAIEKIANAVCIDISDIVQFWYMKRQSRCGVPLIKRLQINQKVSRVSISHEDMDDEDRYLAQRYQKMRRGLETGRLLCEQIKKREIHKRNHILASRDIYKYVSSPLYSIINHTIKALRHRDKMKVFLEPVLNVPGYESIIKKPMDLATMQKKADEFRYANMNEFRNDFNQMMDNCRKFNHLNSWYLNYGEKFDKNGTRIIKSGISTLKTFEEDFMDDKSQVEDALNLMFYNHVEITDYESMIEKELDAGKLGYYLEGKRRTPSPKPEKKATATPKDVAGVTAKKEAGMATPKTEKEKPTTASTPKTEKPANTVTPKSEKPASGATPKTKEAALASTPKSKEPSANTTVTPKSKEPNGTTTPKASIFGADLPKSMTKRKCSTPVGKKNKKIKRGSTEGTLFKQPSITKFFEPNPSAERRASLRQVPAPLMQFRNNVTSPLPSDIPSSESSAEEDDVRPHRRSARLGGNNDSTIQSKDDCDGFQHNDIVTVNGLAGRVIDPNQASLDDQIPLTLKTECRTKQRKDSKICVMLFGQENKWDWYPAHEIQSANIFGSCDGISPGSLRQARQWHHNIVSSV